MIARLPGPRFDLRPLDDGDEALYVRLYTDPEVMRHIGAPQDAQTAADGFRAALGFNAAAPPVRWFWVIHERSRALDLGLLGLSLDGQGGGEVGVVLPVAHQSRGVATAAIAALADHAFGSMQLQRLHTRHAPGHELAAGLMSRLGFERTPPVLADSPWRWHLTSVRWAEASRRQLGANPLP